jgi:hypothetical protein
MNRRGFLGQLGAGLALAGLGARPALAESPVDAVIRQLEGFGYRDISVRRTLLGRVRVQARRGADEREIVLDPRTGEILRDLLRARDGGHLPELRDSQGSNSGWGGRDDDDDDDDDDDHSGPGNGGDDDDDNSGSGGGDDDDDD